MKAWIIIICLLLCLAVPASAADLTAPEAPDSARPLLPYEEVSFAEGLRHIVSKAFEVVFPSVSQALRVCISVFAAVMLIGLLRCVGDGAAGAVSLCVAVVIGCILLEPANSMIRAASETVGELSDYGKLLLPVMTAALAAQGGGGSAAALYAGTALFDTLLSSAVTKLLAPVVYIFLALAVMAAATGDESLQRLKRAILTFISKGLRVVLYIFTGYLTITGVVAGTADQMSVKAAKLTISGMVPVVGNIMAEASETLLVSAGLLKSAAGVYGLLTVIAIGISPFLRIGIQYLLLKATAAAGSMFESKEVTGLVNDFASAMGLLLAMTGAQCMLILVSTVCFMKGMG